MSTVYNDECMRPLAEQLVEVFSSFNPKWTRWLQASLADKGITPARMHLLARLHFKGNQIMSGLSADLGVTPRNVTALVDALETDGLVRRLPHPTDRRAIVIELTPDGTHLCNRLWDDHLKIASALFAELSADDQRALLRIVRHLHERLPTAGAG